MNEHNEYYVLLDKVKELEEENIKLRFILSKAERALQNLKNEPQNDVHAENVEIICEGIEYNGFSDDPETAISFSYLYGCEYMQDWILSEIEDVLQEIDSLEE